MTWTKISNVTTNWLPNIPDTADWGKINNIPTDWAKTKMDPHEVWFVDPWFSGWFVPEGGLLGEWSKISNTTGEWTKIN